MRPLNWFLAFCVLLLTCGLAAGQYAPCTVDPYFDSYACGLGEATSVELGMKFRADSDGYVTGIRSTKVQRIGAPRTGNLWSSSGSLLATTHC